MTTPTPENEGATASDEDQGDAVVQVIWQALEAGQSQDFIVESLVDDDTNAESRHDISELVFSVANAHAAQGNLRTERDSGAAKWMLWAGGLVLVNILSAAFDWGFWVY